MRAASLVAFLFLSFGLLLDAEEIVKDSPAIFATAQERARAIEEEIRSGGQPAWAGVYTYGDGRAVNVRLSLAAKSGFVFEWDGCLGAYDRNYGSIATIDGLIRMNPELPNPSDRALQGMATEFLPITWGERHYLIAPAEIVAFCNAINAREEPRGPEPWSGSFLLREGDETKPVEGKPSLPMEDLPMLLPEPITAQVVEVRSARAMSPRGEASERWKAIEVIVDAGRARGVFTGMEFHLVAPDEVRSGKVMSVAEDSAEAVFYEYQHELPEPSVGWKLSTRPTYR